MIVYGIRATLLKTEHIFEPCPNCRATNSVQLSVFQRYAHIFWIPCFPVGKKGVSVCSSCRQVLKHDQLPASLKLSYDNLKGQANTPLWNFAGVFLVACVIGAVWYSDKQTSEKVSKLLLSPKSGDIFELKINDEVYTLYKVKKVEGDTVYFFPNKYDTNQESGLSDLTAKGDQAFDNSMTYGFSKTRLAEMNRKDQIIDIDRK